MQHQVAVGSNSQASSPQSCGEEVSNAGVCNSKDSEIVQEDVGTPTTSNQCHVPKRSLVRLMERTGYSIVQQNGQRRYGPPPDWDDRQPPRGCEVFVGKIPRDCFEDELVPVFERFGRIYEMRLMMDYNGMNRGYAFVVYTQASDAKECVRALNNWEIRKVRSLYATPMSAMPCGLRGRIVSCSVARAIVPTTTQPMFVRVAKYVLLRMKSSMQAMHVPVLRWVLVVCVVS